MDTGDSTSPLLKRMLRRINLSENELPVNLETWHAFLLSITNLINNYDQERYLLERSMELSSKEMRELYERFETAQDIASIGYWYYDRQEERILWSKETYKIFGLDKTKPVPEFNEVMEFVHEKDREHLLHLIDRAFKEGENYELEFKIYHMPDKKVKWVYVKAHPEIIQDNNHGSKRILSGIIMDITTRKQAEHDLKHLNQKLVEMSRLSGMSEIATSVLHNIGNVLNSVNISASVIQEIIADSGTDKLIKISELINKNIPIDPDFFTKHEKGKLIPAYLEDLSKNIQLDQQKINEEINNLQKYVQHIKDIVVMQKDLSGISGVTEIINLTDLIEAAITIGCGSLEKTNIQLVTKYNYHAHIKIHKSKLLQILVNLIRNAKDALIEDGLNLNRQINIQINKNPNDACIEILIQDNGIGIKDENLNKIFSMGYTTKVNGHGFGLHSSALAAKELGGNLIAKSEGEGKGALFLLKIPATVEVEYEKST